MIQHPKTRGFTLVELLLAMSFLAILLVAIATLTIQVVNIYTRGVTLTAVDQAGQTLAGELQTTLNQSAGNDVQMQSVGGDESHPNGGRLCTGSVSYAWNYGPTITGNDISYATPNTINGSKDVRFVRFPDASGNACVLDKTTNDYPPIPSTATELLVSKDRDLALRAFDLSKNSLGSQVIYTVSMTIATNNGDDFITTGSDTGLCAPSHGANGSGDDSFCAVNTFNFTARSGSMDTTGGGQ